MIRCEMTFTRLYRKKVHVTSPARQLTPGHHTDAPQSALGLVTLGHSLLWSCHQRPLEQSSRPHWSQATGTVWGHREPPQSAAHARFGQFLFITFTFTDSGSPFEKGKVEAAWKKSWAHGTWDFSQGNSPQCQQAPDMGATTHSLVPGRCTPRGCLCPGFYCW